MIELLGLYNEAEQENISGREKTDLRCKRKIIFKFVSSKASVDFGGPAAL